MPWHKAEKGKPSRAWLPRGLSTPGEAQAKHRERREHTTGHQCFIPLWRQEMFQKELPKTGKDKGQDGQRHKPRQAKTEARTGLHRPYKVRRRSATLHLSELQKIRNLARSLRPAGA